MVSREPLAQQFLDATGALTMCGILGLVSLSRETISRSSVQSIADRLAHRGPDASGTWISPHGRVGLGHRRLSIIDLDERANQPMSDPEGNVWLSFNGEIYNYVDIRKELGDTFRPRTTSDTEVLIQAYKTWGLEGALRRFRGFFGFALYDAKADVLFLVRDRFGKKPLYYATRGGTLAFASEVQALRDVMPLVVRDEAVAHYLMLGCTPAPGTFFNDVQKVPAGTYLRVDVSAGTATSHTYYDIAERLTAAALSDDRPSIDRLEEVQEEAVRLRMVSDVPVALALSGGLDSSLNAYYCRHEKPLCVSFVWKGGNAYAEDNVARLVAKTFGLPFQTLTLDPEEFTQRLREYLLLQTDVPIGDINTVLIYTMSRHLREIGYKVGMVGEGGDEIGGYSAYRSVFRNAQALRRIPGIGRTLLKKAGGRWERLANYAQGSEVLPFHILLGFHQHELAGMWRKDPVDTYRLVSELMGQVSTGRSPRDRYLRKVSVLEYKLRLPELILARIDYPSMAASIEMRSPFMDHVLIETHNLLSWDDRLTRSATKVVFRKIAERHLPGEVLRHPKVGLTHVLVPFLEKTLPALFTNEVVRQDAPIKEYLEPRFLEWASAHLRNENLWRLYALNHWLGIHR